MSYSNRFVACILVDGRPQRELANGTVPLHFGSEYSLRFRNKHNRRAVVKFSIDGEDESGPGYVVPANGHIDVHRHVDIDQSFRFVSTESEEAVDAGKNGPNHNMEKGLIEARFYLEKKRKTPLWKPIQHQHHHHHHYRSPPTANPYNPYPYGTWCSIDGGGLDATTDSGGLGDSSTSTAYTVQGFADPSRGMLRSCSASSAETFSLDDGCTVGGEATGQEFCNVWVDTEATCTTVKLFLRGMSAEDEAYPYPFTQGPAKSKKSRPNKKLRELETENERLRAEIAEAENRQLKEKLESLEG